MTDREALIIINMIPGIGPIKIQELLTRFENLRIFFNFQRRNSLLFRALEENWPMPLPIISNRREQS